MRDCAGLWDIGRGMLMGSLAVVVLAGCSDGGRLAGTVPVTGKVSYNGQAVEGATITFSGQAAGAGMTAADGTFNLPLKPGSYTVLVSKTDRQADTREVSMEEAAANAGKEQPSNEPKNLLPAKYNSPAESPVKFDVKASGENKLDVTLTD